MWYADAKNLVDTAIRHDVLREEACVAIYHEAGEDPAHSPEGWYLESKESVYHSIMENEEGQRCLIDALKEKGVLFQSGAAPTLGLATQYDIQPCSLPHATNGHGQVNVYADGSIRVEAHPETSEERVKILSNGNGPSLEFLHEFLMERQAAAIKELVGKIQDLIEQGSVLCSVNAALDAKKEAIRIGEENEEK